MHDFIERLLELNAPDINSWINWMAMQQSGFLSLVESELRAYVLDGHYEDKRLLLMYLSGYLGRLARIQRYYG